MNGNNILYYRFLLLLVSCCCLLSCRSGSDAPRCMHGEEHYLRFSSYEVSPDSRTSFSIPSDGDGIVFRDYLALSFDCRIIPDIETFGYVCRMVIDGRKSVDVCLRNPRGGRHYLCLISDNEEIMAFFNEEDEDVIFGWNNIALELHVSEGELLLLSEGRSFSCGNLSPDKHSISIHFGANAKEGFATTDCAPMELKNVSISLSSGKEKYHWSLDGHWTNENIPDDNGRSEASVKNPIWSVCSHYHWNKVFEYTSESRIFPVVDRNGKRTFFVSGDMVAEYDLHTGRSLVKQSAFGVDATKITNNFIVHPDGKRIIYYDFDKDGIFSEYDISKGEWSHPVGREKFSRSLGHNSFFSPADSSLVQIFGYGFHIYNNIAHLHCNDGHIDSLILSEIPPRYLGSIFLDSDDRSLFVLGGRGNRTGVQEFGINTYGDLWRVGLDDFSCTLVTENLDTDSEVSAPNFHYDKQGHKISGLFYSPNRSNTLIHFRTIDLDTGESSVYGEDIPFFFIDTESCVDMIMDIESENCYTVTSERDNGKFRASIYMISLPVLSSEDFLADKADNDHRSAMLAICGFLFLVISGGAAAYIIKRRTLPSEAPGQTAKAADTDYEEDLGLNIQPLESTEPGIYLINGFKVIDRDGNDISKNFTPVMKHLLAMIILYTESNSGISNAELKDAFWLDKSDSSYFNNRSVLFHKIRLQLATVDDGITIKSSNGKWIYDDAGRGLCDYLRNLSLISSMTHSDINEDRIRELVRIAHCGELLAYVQHDGFDRFKAEYTDKILDALIKMRDDRQYSGNDALRNELCNCILLFDALDEMTLRIKCGILLRHKHIGKAHALFSNFTKEYQKYIGEEFACSFNEFVQKDMN